MLIIVYLADMWTRFYAKQRAMSYPSSLGVEWV